jgi:hypothetical protein
MPPGYAQGMGHFFLIQHKEFSSRGGGAKTRMSIFILGWIAHCLADLI